ncbi:MAG: DNA primase [Rhodocyclaceae bacterium]|nr:DNA primase [Rhodocyclaceae bacterium]
MIPESFIQDLLARVDIVEVIGRHLRLKKGGANYLACCPFHNEKSPSFTVSPSKQFYHCFGCGAHGSAIGFVMEYVGLNFPDAVEDLARFVGLSVPRDQNPEAAARHERSLALGDLMGRAARFYREQLKTSAKAVGYLKSRGLTGEIAKRYGLGYAPDDWSPLRAEFPDYANSPQLAECGLVIDNDGGRRWDRFRDRIMFPILDGRGQVIGFGGRVLGAGEPKYLNSPETPLFEKGRELYGLFQARQAIREAECVIVTEGYMDVIALAQHGVTHAVAALGTATTPMHVQKLLRATERVVFCFDGDSAGRKAAWRALEASLEQVEDGNRLSFLFLPPEHDPDSYVRAHGAEAFSQAAAGATPLSGYLLQELKERHGTATAEARAALVGAAGELLKRLRAPLLRMQMVHQLAQITGLAAQEIEAGCQLPALAAPTREAPRRAPRRKPSSTERKLLGIVLCHPTWAARLPPDLPPGDSEEWQALAAIANLVDHGELPTGGLGALVEALRDTPHQAVVAALGGELLLDSADEADMEQEFNDTLEHLRGRLVAREIERYISISRERRLDGEEQREFSRLLAEKQKMARPKPSH